MNVWKYVEIFITFACLIVGVSIIYVFIHFNNERKKIKTGSYVASVNASLHYQETSEAREIAGNLSKEWRFLNKQEYTKLAKAMSGTYSCDRGGLSYEPDRILFDHWGRHILIAGRKLPDKNPEFMVWSKGPDGIFRTEDDISSPWQTLPPAILKEYKEE